MVRIEAISIVDSYKGINDMLKNDLRNVFKANSINIIARIISSNLYPFVLRCLTPLDDV